MVSHLPEDITSVKIRNVDTEFIPKNRIFRNVWAKRQRKAEIDNTLNNGEVYQYESDINYILCE